MERTQAIGKDVIIHRDMTSEEREREFQKLKEESNQLDEWKEEMVVDKEYERICKKLGFIPSEFKAPDFETEDDSWESPFKKLTADEIEFLLDNGYLDNKK